MGTNTAVGMDAINFFVIVGYTLAKRIDEQNIDRWEFIRDDLSYLVGIGLVCVFGSMGVLQWWMGFVIIIYFFIYVLLRRRDEKIKEGVYRALGLIRDDDVFNVSNNLRQQKRRNSISDIVTKEFKEGVTHDATLKKKIRRAEGIIKLNEGSNPKITPENVNHWIKWHSLTTMIIHANKKRTEKLKSDRAEKYREELALERHKNRVKNEESEESLDTSRNIDVENPDNNGVSGPVETPRLKDEAEEKDEHSQLIEDGDQKKKEEAPKESEENEKAVEEKENDQKLESEELPSVQDVHDKAKESSENDVSPPENQFPFERKESDKTVELSKPHDDHFSHHDAGTKKLVNEQTMFYMEDDEDNLKEEDYNLSFPRGFWNRVAYFVFFPINLITYFLIPNWRHQSKANKVLLGIMMTFAILAGLSFLLLWWFEKVAYAINAKPEMLGSCFASIGFSIPFIVYNIKLYNDRGDEHTFYTVFRQIGIFRIGICIGWSWLIGSAVASASLDNNELPFGGISVSYYVLAGLMLVNMILVAIKKCKLPSKFSYICFIFYVIWWVANFVLCQFYPQF